MFNKLVKVLALFFMYSGMTFFLIWFYISNALFTMVLANNKEYNGFMWLLGSLFFGPLALLTLIGMPDRKSKEYLRVIAEILDEMEFNSL